MRIAAHGVSADTLRAVVGELRRAVAGGEEAARRDDASVASLRAQADALEGEIAQLKGRMGEVT
jgi:hypothetical protein